MTRRLGKLGERILDVLSRWEARASHLLCLPSHSFEPGLRSGGENDSVSDIEWEVVVRQADGVVRWLKRDGRILIRIPLEIN